MKMYIKDLPKFPKETRNMSPGALAYKEYAEKMNELLPELKEVIKFYNTHKPKEGVPMLIVRDDSRKRGSKFLFMANRNEYGRFEVLANTDLFQELNIRTPDVHINISGYKVRSGGYQTRVSVSSKLMSITEEGRENIKLQYFDDSRGWNASLLAFGKRSEYGGGFEKWMMEAQE